MEVVWFSWPNCANAAMARTARSESATVLAIQAPRHHRPEVVEVGEDAGPPHLMIVALHAGHRDLGELGEVLGVPAPPPVGVVGLVELLAREEPQGLEHGVAGGGAGPVFGHEHRLRHQARDRVDHPPRVEHVVADDRGGAVGVERAREHPEPVEDGAVVVVEQLVRPVDRRPQGLLALDATAALPGEEAEAFVEMTGDLGR